MSPRLKQSLHWVGSVLAIAGIVFIAFRLNDYSSQLDLSRFDAFTWTVVAVYAVIYGLANIMLALAWWNLLDYFGATTSKLWSVRVYGLTQLAKYVPGNIMHFASRQAMGLAVDIPGWSLVKSSVWELGLISIAGALFSILVLPQFLPIVTAPMVLTMYVGILLIIMLGLKRHVSLSVARAFGCYIVFLIISGMVFVGVLALLGGESSIDPWHVILYCSAFVVAWLVGLVTPGAPAGVGVRELVLVVLLRGLVLESDLLLAVLLSRLVTIGGDVLFFLFALRFSNRESSCG